MLIMDSLESEVQNMESRFEAVKQEDIAFNDWTMEVFVLRDKQTGVMYMYRVAGGGAGLTVLVDKDGKPITTFKVNI